MDPNYGRDVSDGAKRPAERSRSAPSGSPKPKKKDTKKKKTKADQSAGQQPLSNVCF